jgi:hypothetical protein
MRWIVIDIIQVRYFRKIITSFKIIIFSYYSQPIAEFFRGYFNLNLIYLIFVILKLN